MTLQDIPGKLRLGEDVQIVTDNGTDQFLYQVTGTRVVHEDDLTLEGDGGPSIHLVSCVPRLVYDHRLIVDAELIARKSIN
jgi:sortase (surface protein transpeptidase)